MLPHELGHALSPHEHCPHHELVKWVLEHFLHCLQGRLVHGERYLWDYVADIVTLFTGQQAGIWQNCEQQNTIISLKYPQFLHKYNVCTCSTLLHIFLWENDRIIFYQVDRENEKFIYKFWNLHIINLNPHACRQSTCISHWVSVMYLRVCGFLPSYTYTCL